MSSLPAQHPAGKPPRGALTASSLCTGYSGLDLAVMAVTGARLAWTAETDRYAAAVLVCWPTRAELSEPPGIMRLSPGRHAGQPHEDPSAQFVRP